MQKILNKIKYHDLEYFSYLLLLLWTISPVIEYILKYVINNYQRYYFVVSIYFIGTLGLLEYALYTYKQIHDKSFHLKNYFPHLLLLLLLIISLISSILSKNTYLSFFGEGYRKEGLIVYIMYLGFILSASTIHNSKYIVNLFKAIISSALIIAIIPLTNDNFTYTAFTNVFRNFNHYGYYLMISTCLSAYLFVKCHNKRKILYFFIYIILLYMLIRNNTFGCYLALTVSIIFSFIYSLIKKTKRISILILLITFVSSSIIISHYDIKIGEQKRISNNPGLVSNNIETLSKDLKTILNSNNEKAINSTGSGRGRLWKNAYTYITKNPYFGGGMECLKAYYKENNIRIDRPHNIILQIAAFIGIPGAIIYLLLIIYLALSNLKYLKDNSLNLIIYETAMCYFISSLFGNSMYYTSPYFMILLGLLINIKSRNTPINE